MLNVKMLNVKNTMKMHRPYEGKTKEVKSCERKAENQPMACQSKK